MTGAMNVVVSYLTVLVTLRLSVITSMSYIPRTSKSTLMCQCLKLSGSYEAP